MNFTRFILLFTVTVVLSLGSVMAADQIIALKAARLFDGKSRALIQNGVVVVQGDKIADAGANVAIPPDAQVIDLGDATLSPDSWTRIHISRWIIRTTRRRVCESCKFRHRPRPIA